MTKPVTSENLFEFIKISASPRIITLQDGNTQQIPGDLSEEGLAAALEQVVKLVEIEKGFALQERSLEAHLAQQNSFPPSGGPTGIVN